MKRKIVATVAFGIVTSCIISRNQSSNRCKFASLESAKPQIPTVMASNKYFDHTALKADVSLKEIELLCKEAVDYNFASVCVNSCHVKLVKKLLKGTDVKVCCVVGFPLGAMCTSGKVAEVIYCAEAGADEIDMVLNVGYLKSKMDREVVADIYEVSKACHQHGMICKVILETCLLSQEEKERASRLAVVSGADFIKTSTGFSSGGATVEDVRLMASIAHPHGVLVKASGGIRTGKVAYDMINSGADRLGTSATVSAFKELQQLQQPFQIPLTNTGTNNSSSTGPSSFGAANDCVSVVHTSKTKDSGGY